MMRRRSPPPANHVADDEVARIARRYRVEAAATLIAVCRSETAPAAARAQAASRLLEYAEGRPATARQIAVSDLENMTGEQREALFEALLRRYQVEFPGFFEDLVDTAVKLAVDEALKLQAAGKKRFGFKRGPGAGRKQVPETHLQGSSMPGEGEAAANARPDLPQAATQAQPAAGDLPDRAALPPPAPGIHPPRSMTPEQWHIAMGYPNPWRQ
jgi:hypothetical protein